MWWKYIGLACSLFVLLWVQSGKAQIAIYEVRLDNLLKMQQGIGWPLHLDIMEGHDALMKLSSTLENQQDCTVVSPTGVSFSVSSPPSNRYESWTDGCSLRVRSVVPSDAGRWRLTAVAGDNSLTGWIEVHVEPQVSSYDPAPISLLDGVSAGVDLTTLNNSYCLVTKPFTESSLIPGHCHVTLDHTTRAVQGKWNVLLGLPGKVTELQVSADVAVKSERIDAGYIHDTQGRKMHLYCNILNSEKNITFCRFQRTTESIGYNIMDGLSDSQHSYYGDGFSVRQCGMTIETVANSDYGTWRCTVGLQEWATATTIRQSTPMQALIRVQPPSGTRIQRDLRPRSTEVRTIFAQKGASFSIMCNADMSLAYCWFQHPNGSQFTPVERQSEDDDFWYTGDSLLLGDCGITFAHATDDDAGNWTCHMGPRYEIGLEETDEIILRVTGPLAANINEITTPLGSEVTLYCHTSSGPKPLDYCRFLTPTALGISIDPSVTAENSILNRFYFTPGRDLDHGDCSLTISGVLAEDYGVWTCAALLYDDTSESRDTVTVYQGSTSRSVQFRAGMIGMSVGVIVLGALLVGIVWYKKYPRFSANEPNVRLRVSSGTTVTNDMSDQSTNSDNGSGYQIEILPTPVPR